MPAGEGCGLSPRTGVNPKGGDRMEKPAESHRAAQGGEEAAGASERHSGLPSAAFPKSGS